MDLEAGPAGALGSSPTLECALMEPEEWVWGKLYLRPALRLPLASVVLRGPVCVAEDQTGIGCMQASALTSVLSGPVTSSFPPFFSSLALCIVTLT